MERPLHHTHTQNKCLIITRTMAVNELPTGGANPDVDFRCEL